MGGTGTWSSERDLGAGAFGSVRLWRQAGTDRRIVLKLCGPMPLPMANRWHTEMQMLFSMSCRNIVSAIQMPDDLYAAVAPIITSRTLVLCTEYCSGGNLRQYLDRIENINGLPESEIKSILNDIKTAIAYLHLISIVHKDLKPENIGLCPIENDPDRKYICKLTDLGHTKYVDANCVSETFHGQLQYYSPELLVGKSPTTEADLWSLGLIAFEISCGYFPFLPNFSAPKRMLQVIAKQSSHICIHQDWNEKIVFSDEIFRDNHLSDCFNTALTYWIQLALEINPTKRSKSEEKGTGVKFTLPDNLVVPHRNIDAYSALESVLNKEILTIFSIMTYERLSYVIDHKTDFSALQSWIERDTQIPIDQQLFITGDNKSVDIQNSVLDYHRPELDNMIYLHRKGLYVTKLSSLKPNLSFKIKRCVEQAKTKLQHYQLLDTFTSIRYFISNEKCLFKSMVNGTANRVDYLKNEVKNLYENYDDIESNICKLTEKSDMLLKMIEIDNIRLPNLPSTLDNVNKIREWISKCDTFQQRVDKLKTCRNQLKVRLDSVKRRCECIDDKDTYAINFTEFDDHIEEVDQAITALRIKPKSEQKNNNPCVEAANLFYRCLNVRSRALYYLEKRKILQIILDLQMESEKISSLIVAIGKNTEDVLNVTTSLILEKHELMWQLFESQYDNRKTVNYTSTDFRIGESVRDPRSSLSDVEIPNKSNSQPIIQMVKFNSLIKENMKLMEDSNNFLNESHNLIKNELNNVLT